MEAVCTLLTDTQQTLDLLSEEHLSDGDHVAECCAELPEEHLS